MKNLSLPLTWQKNTQDNRPRTRCCATNCPRFAAFMVIWSTPIVSTPGCRPRQFTLCKAHLRQFLGSGLTIEPYSNRDPQ